MANIEFVSEEISFKLDNQQKIKDWIHQVFISFETEFDELNYIFCSDEYLLKINKEFLNHDTYTDIITFSNHEDDELINSDIFISTERVQENATKFNQTFNDELRRVMIHGVLHLLGFKDKTEEEEEEMREKEDYSLSLYQN